ncbi:MAG: DNA polymerase III subunit alpha [Pseudomonadota bacterium]
MSDLTTQSPFVHLHVHSDYSIMDGTLRIQDYVKKVKSMGHKHAALTDHGNMFGTIDFYEACKKSGITPIVGCEINYAGAGMTPALSELLDLKMLTGGVFHLVLLAKNTLGYKNLLKIVSSGWTVGLKNDLPIVPNESLETYSSDLVVLSSCMMGEFAFLVGEARKLQPSGRLDYAFVGDDFLGEIMGALRLHVETICRLFGKENYYIELIDNNLKEQKKIIPDLISAAEFFGLKIVATCDAHYTEASFADTHALAISVKNSLTETDIRQRLRDAEFHVLNNEEMLHKFSHVPTALSHTLEIAEICSHVSIEMDKYYLPKFDLGTGETSDAALIRLSSEGLNKRLTDLEKIYGPQFTKEKQQEYWSRLNFENEMIIKMGFPGYFLIVQDFINWAKMQDIPVGPGRGSGAGSLVAYALRITDLDPIPYNLIFERFLNPERVSMPDFDVDFCQWRRDEVIAYVARRYGSENVAQITTFGKLLAKGAVKAIGRALNVGYSKMDRFTKLFPDELNITLEKALLDEPKLKEEMEKDDAIRRCVEEALKLEGLTSNLSTHAAGIVISDGPMTNYVPIYTTDGKTLITQYEMKKAEKVGLIKFDFLGLKTLTVIQKATELIRLQIDPSFDIAHIPLQDKKVYQLISSGCTTGIFQCESDGMTKLILKLQPSCFEDIIALVALFRPGPLGSGMVDDFVERKHGRQEITYLHPDLAPILKDTYGMILYQEQVQKIAATLAQYSLGEADLLRRAMGKKDKVEMERQKNRFIEGCQQSKVDPKISGQLFDLMEKFAEYGFNKSHSAAYGLVAYQTAYMKTHFTEQFMAAIMTCDLDNTKKIARYIEDSVKLGFQILPPNINRSFTDFDVPRKKTIGYGLSAIKGLGEAGIKPILDDRTQNGLFTSLSDLARRLDLSKIGKKTLEILTEVGALDDFGYSRKELLNILDQVIKWSSGCFATKNKGQISLFSFAESEPVEVPHWEAALGQPKPEARTWDFEGLLAEKKLLGMFLTGHPMELYKQEIKLFSNSNLRDMPSLLAADGKGPRKVEVALVVFLSEQFQRRTMKGNLMASLRLEELGTSVEAVIFERALMECPLPESNTPVLVIGHVERNFDGNGSRLSIERVLPLSEVRAARVKRIHLLFKSPQNQIPSEAKKRIESLASTMRLKKGPTQVHLAALFPKALVEFNTQDIKIDLDDEMMAKLSNEKDLGLQFEMFTHPLHAQS